MELSLNFVNSFKLLAFLKRFNLIRNSFYRRICWRFGLIGRLKRACQKKTDGDFRCQLAGLTNADGLDLEQFFQGLKAFEKKQLLKWLVAVDPFRAVEFSRTIGYWIDEIRYADLELNPERYSPCDVQGLVHSDYRANLNSYNYSLLNSPEKNDDFKRYFEALNIASYQRKSQANPLYIDNVYVEDSLLNTEEGSDYGLVSIILTAHNESELISYSVSSLLQQAYQNIQIVFVNDGCTDDTVERFVQTCEKNDFNNYKLINLSDKFGPFFARNKGIKDADGEYITFHDADDWAHPERISMQLEALNQTGIKACYTELIRVGKNGHLFSKTFFPLNKNAMVTLMFKKDIVLEMGYFYTDVLGADSEYYERMKLFYGMKSVKNVPIPLILAAHRAGSQTTSEMTGTPEYGVKSLRLSHTEIWRERLLSMVANESSFYVDFNKK
jgi:hypothetical protein